MGLITEIFLRQKFPGNQQGGVFTLSKGDKLTPSAMDFLSVHHIEVIEKEEAMSTEPEDKSSRYGYPRSGGDWKTPETYKVLYDGRTVDKKPEGMTHLYENMLVYKDEPRIVLRGRLDTYQAYIIEAQVMFLEKFPRLVPVLEELLAFTRQLLGYEVLNKPLPDIKLLGLTMEELNDRSHNPQKYFGMKQMVLPTHSDGLAVAVLNRLRAEAREIELVAVSAFRKGEQMERNDIIMGLNRLSSAFHILMYQELSQK